MSVDLVRNQIHRFLSTDTPEVLAIKGGWGVGKTYSWEKYIEEFKGDCALNSYSYVSLFGINSISELKQTTFLNTIDINRIGEAPNIKGYSKKIADLVKDTKIPYVSKYVGGIGSLINSVSQLAMNKTIICFDDLERHSNGITIKDFMGLVSFFKEQKNCKVVLLLNEQAGDETFEDYRKYKEKVVDRQLHFEPTAEQCFDTMFAGGFEFREYVRDCCIGLDIKNKRVIRKIVEHTKEFLELVKGFDESIKKQVVHSTIVLSWCYYCHGSDEEFIPEFDFVKRSGIRKENEKNGWSKDLTTRWNMILNRYGYVYADEIDLAVAHGIEQGFLDSDKFIPFCNQKQKEIEISQSSVKWDDAWKLFHGSFNHNENNIALAFEEGMRDIAATTSASQYSSALEVLRSIGENKKADELIDFFINSKFENSESLNVDSSFSFEVKDEIFVERLRDAYLKIRPELSVNEILELRSGSSSYNSSEADILAKLETEDIYMLFMSFEGEKLTDYIRVFMLLAGSNQILAKKVNSVLERIESMSELNKSRMKKFRS